MKYILGVNAFHADASAVLLENGNVIAGIEEEKFTRLKHWSGFPKQSIKWCLQNANINFSDISHIGINTNPKSQYFRKIKYLLSTKPNFEFYIDRFRKRSRGNSIKEILKKEFCENNPLKAQIHYLDHHFCHMSSAYFPSKYSNASVLSIDGFGDFSSTAWGVGMGPNLKLDKRILFPDSLGAFYSSITQFLGFKNYGDEYKVMGLAPYGKPIYEDELRQFLRINENGIFSLNQKYIYWKKDNPKEENGIPIIYTHFHPCLEELIGKSRGENESLNERHKNIASSVQYLYEDALFKLLNSIYDQYKIKDLCIAGGCGSNSVANGKITANTNFESVYIHPSPGDSGGALGAALGIWHKYNDQKCPKMVNVFIGYKASEDEIANTIKKTIREKKDQIIVKKIGDRTIKNENDYYDLITSEIIKGKVIGWFQGRVEWGPRALGNRSIIGDPRRQDMREIINKKIKMRESFRPFAPSILQEKCNEWFVTKYQEDNHVPYMTKVYKFKDQKKELVPAVCHVDGTGRLQTVSKDDNEKYYKLIKTFHEKTQVPILLNTSFNENEPIVCKTKEAMECFLRTKMDIIVIGDFIISKNN